MYDGIAAASSGMPTSTTDGGGAATIVWLLGGDDYQQPSQHDAWSSSGPRRSHGKRTLMRPWKSTWISSPGGPTTVAVCAPCTTGRGVLRAGRHGTPARTQVKRLA